MEVHMTDAASGANAAQSEYWNHEGGANWLAMQERVERQLAPLGRRAIERAAFQTGEHVLDIGCGTGRTTLEIGARVGARGTATGVDISRPLLAVARERLHEAGATNVSFREADAQTVVFGSGSYDGLFSRFGVMFFADPVTAFGNLLGALRPGGRLTFLAWRSAAENEWVVVPMEAAFRHLARPPAADPDAPGQFAFASPDRIRDVLSRAGFADTCVDKLDMSFGGGTLDQTVAALLE